jgi:hypothetical protein
MTLVSMEGFDTAVVPVGFSVDVGASFTTGRLGVGKAYRSTDNGTTGPFARITHVLGNAGAERIVGTAFRRSDVPASGQTVFEVMEGSTTHLKGVLDASLRLQVMRGDGTVLGTAANPLDTQTWQFYEIAAKIHDTTGYCKVYLNGGEIISVTGADTRNGGTAGLFDTARWNGSPGVGTWCEIDDVYVIDPTTGAAPYNAPLGDVKVETLRPTGDGDSSQWLGSDGNSVANWQLVDDDSTTTDYVGSATPGATDLYTLSDPTGIALGEILAVQVEMYASKSDAGTPAGDLLVALKSVLGTADTEVVATPAQLSTAWQVCKSPILTSDPDGNAWTEGRLAGLQAGPALAP